MKRYIKAYTEDAPRGELQAWEEAYEEDLRPNWETKSGDFKFKYLSPGYYAYRFYNAADYKKYWEKYFNLPQIEAIELWERALSAYKRDGQKAMAALWLYADGYDAVSTVFKYMNQLQTLQDAIGRGIEDISPIFDPSLSAKQMKIWIDEQLGIDRSVKKLPKIYQKLPDDQVAEVKNAVDTLRKVAHDWYYKYGDWGWNCTTTGGQKRILLEIVRTGPANGLIEDDVVDDILDEASEKSGYPREYFSWWTTDASYPSYGYLKLKVEVPKKTK